MRGTCRVSLETSPSADRPQIPGIRVVLYENLSQIFNFESIFPLSVKPHPASELPVPSAKAPSLVCASVSQLLSWTTMAPLSGSYTGLSKELQSLS